MHGNFALANSAGGRFCGVDSEMQVLADTGCYADFTLPTRASHPAQTAKINSLYECGLAAGRSGTSQNRARPQRGPRAAHFSADGARAAADRLCAQPASVSTHVGNGSDHGAESDDSRPARALEAGANPRGGRPDWLFIKLHCHGMDPTQKDAVDWRVCFRDFLKNWWWRKREERDSAFCIGQGDG